MSATVVLSVSDQFSGPLDAYAAKIGAADAASAKMAGSLAQADSASAKLSSSVQQTAAAQGQLQAATVTATTAQDAHTASSGNLSTSLLGVYAAVGLVRQGISMVQGAYKDVIGDTLAYGDQVRQLSRTIGTSAEDSSKLIYASTQMGVSFQTLTTGIEAAIRTMKMHKSAGIEPNIEGLGILSDRYLAIQDPIAKTKFLMDNFGRSGADMAALMLLGSAGLKQLGDQATNTGTVLSGPALAAMLAYEQETKNLNASILGIKIAITEQALPPLTKLVDAYSSNIEVQNRYNAVLKAGIFTQNEITSIQIYDAFGLKAQGVEILKNAEARMAQARSLVGVSDASDRATAAQQAQAVAIAQVTTKANEKHSIDMEQLDFMLKNGDAIGKQIDAYYKLAAAQQAAADKLVLSAGMSGRLTAAEAAYGAVVETDAPKLAKLNAELAKLEAVQGTVTTATAKGKMSQEDYQILVDRTALALAKYDEALASVGGKHAKTALTIEGLRISWQNYVNTLDDANGKLQTSSTVTVDNSTKIAALKAQIDPLVDAENKAKDAIDKATAALIFQGVSANLPIEAQTRVAFALGMVSKADYDLAVAAEAARAGYDKNIKGGMDASKAADQLSNSLAALKYNTENSYTALPKLGQGLSDVGGQAGGAAWAVGNLAERIAALHDVHINVTTDIYENHHTWHDQNSKGGGGAAGGANFTVPPGYPNDSFPMRVQSGEHVIVIPAPGGSGGSTMNFGGITVNAAPGQDGVSLWNMIKSAAAREARGQILSGAAGMGM